jgi:rhamnosyltransferase
MDAVKIYEEYFKRKQDVLSGMVNYYKERGDTIALWGAGKKGTGFLNVADLGNKIVNYVFDKDISKSGQVMPTGHVIADYTETNASVIFVANSNIELDVMDLMYKVDPGARIINIDNIILGDLSLEDIILPKRYVVKRIRNYKICAVVVVYNPEQEVIENIESYINDVDLLYIYDNSTENKSELFKKFDNIKVKYIKKKENMGLAYAYNEVAEMAVKEKCDWMITFDQDSMACNGMLNAMKKYAESSMCMSDIAVIAPITKRFDNVNKKNENYITYYYKVIQSGAMHNLQIMQKIGGYDENMFIDEVDFEYCARCIVNGYKIVKVNNAVLMHNMQDINVKRKFVKGVDISINKFSPDRYYYCYRNALYCYDKYKIIHPIYALDCSNSIKIMETSLEYNSNFEENSQAINQAIDDYNNGVMGKRKLK